MYVPSRDTDVATPYSQVDAKLLGLCGMLLILAGVGEMRTLFLLLVWKKALASSSRYELGWIKKQRHT
jgi:hypothetical protein